MDIWKKNMWICTAASFIVSIGMSQMAPIMPLYIEELGVTDADAIAMWAGIVFGCNFISLAIFSPIWGRLSDKYGRKPMMLRASAWLGLIMVGMGLAGNVWHLVILRLLQGALSGFQAAAIPLIAQETPSERSGWAMSIFFTGQVSGGLLGPVVGGWLSEIFGYRQTFFIIGAFCSLSLGAVNWLHVGDKTLFDVFDFVTGQIFLPIGGFLTCIFLGWFIPKSIVKDEFTNWGTLRGRFFGVFLFLVRFVCPLAILGIFLHQFNVI